MISCFTLLSKEEGKLLSFIKIQLSNFTSKNIFYGFHSGSVVGGVTAHLSFHKLYLCLNLTDFPTSL